MGQAVSEKKLLIFQQAEDFMVLYLYIAQGGQEGVGGGCKILILPECFTI